MCIFARKMRVKRLPRRPFCKVPYAELHVRWCERSIFVRKLGRRGWKWNFFEAIPEKLQRDIIFTRIQCVVFWIFHYLCKLNIYKLFWKDCVLFECSPNLFGNKPLST